MEDNHPSLRGCGITTPTGIFGSKPRRNIAEMLSRPLWTSLVPTGQLPLLLQPEGESYVPSTHSNAYKCAFVLDRLDMPLSLLFV